jgi:hypothetical protein
MSSLAGNGKPPEVSGKLQRSSACVEELWITASEMGDVKECKFQFSVLSFQFSVFFKLGKDLFPLATATAQQTTENSKLKTENQNTGSGFPALLCFDRSASALW